jgi:hypothetical protein
MDRIELYIKLILGILCVLIFMVVVTWMTISNEQTNRLYPRIVIDDGIRDKIAFIKIEKGNARVSFEGRIKRTIYFARNCQYEPSDLPFFIKSGDSLRKQAGSDTIRILRNDDVFLFINGDDINCQN